jgi:hypothetical protein
MATLWDLQKLIRDGNSSYGEDPSAPYASEGDSNHVLMHENASRLSTKREREIAHCRAMQAHCCQNGKMAQAVDWSLSALTLSDRATSYDLSELYLNFYPIGDRHIEVTLSQFQHDAGKDLDRRLIGATVFRCLNAPGIGDTEDKRLPREAVIRLIAILAQTMPDLCKELRLDTKLDHATQLSALRIADDNLATRLVGLEEATSALDIHRFCSLHSPVQTSINHKLVRAIFEPFLPRGFMKTKILPLFKLMDELRQAPSNQLTSVLPSCFLLIDDAISELEWQGTFYSKRYFVPLFIRARAIVQSYFDNSDATRPAELDIAAYPKKYPLQQLGAAVKLKFLLKNRGRGPAPLVDVSFEFGNEVTPAEARHTFTAMDVTAYEVEVPVSVVKACPSLYYIATLQWSNYDGSERQEVFDGLLEAQQQDIDWDSLSKRDPYSLDAIEIVGSRPFIGRAADLQRLYRAVITQSMGSAIVHGQKRVGKTSLANELVKEAKRSDPDLEAIYLDGNYTQPTAIGTIQNLGSELSRKMKRLSRHADRLEIPTFGESLTPFVGHFLDELLDLESNKRFLIVLDEFDELPVELYKRGPIADSFFLHLRSLSNKPRVGLVIVGGENIRHILASQGSHLNKWTVLPLDYFDKQHHWNDFVELIRRPVAPGIEYLNDAIEEIYRWTDGNPYFTNIICQEIYQHCTLNKDASVSRSEVEEAVSRKLEAVDVNMFHHFWTDGIERGEFVEEISIRRRRILLAIANLLQKEKACTLATLKEEPLLTPIGYDSIARELKQFVERRVLVRVQDAYKCRVHLFESWLRDLGNQKVSIQHTDRDERERAEQRERDLTVTPEELQPLSSQWLYRGQRVTTDAIRTWLNQFNGNYDKRLMFQLLTRVKFYSQDEIRVKLREGMGIVNRRITERRIQGQAKRRDILLTSFGSVGKSGTKYARLFAQENKIVTDSIFDMPKILKRMASDMSSVRCVVSVDDIIGSGESAIGGVKMLADEAESNPNIRSVPWFYVAVCGFGNGTQLVEKTIAELDFPMEVFVCDPLGEADRAFSEESTLFLTEADRTHAYDLCYRIGLDLENQHPLGYNTCQGLVVFEDSCPNNSLPILWKAAKAWTPLFPRF